MSALDIRRGHVGDRGTLCVTERVLVEDYPGLDRTGCMTPAALAVAVHDLGRSAAVLETDVATQTTPGGHNGGLGTHVQPPWRSACVQFIGVALPVSTLAPQSACDEK